MAVNKLSYLVSFINKNGLKLPFSELDGSRFRFIFGAGRSGTTWLGNGLSYTESNVQFISEPLPHFIPRIKMGTTDDISFADNNEKINEWHPFILMLKKIQKGLTADDFIPNYFNRKVIKDCLNPEYYLIKEVHSHFLLKQIINYLPSSKFVFIRRNPLYVLDSYLTYKNENDGLWKQEAYLFKNNNRNLYEEIVRKFKNSIGIFKIDKLLGISFINDYLAKCLNNNVIIISYNSLCLNPLDNFNKIANFFDFIYGDCSIDSLKKTLMCKTDSFIHTSIYQNTLNQIDRDFRRISDKEVVILNSILEYLELKNISTGV